MADPYPEIAPYERGMLDVDDGQRVYWEVRGNPDGKPAVMPHGGPGFGCTPGYRRSLDPDAYRIVLFDQRGAGRSTPHAGDPGLAIGSAYAIGELALGGALVIGFAIHNTTEGLAVVVPLAGRPVSLLRLLGLGLLAGAPAVAGTLIGSTVVNAELSAFLLGIGVGAIIQVIVQIWPSLRDRASGLIDPVAYGGLAAGALVMYATGLLVVI